jgi:amino acid adenylation domain-containing protein
LRTSSPESAATGPALLTDASAPVLLLPPPDQAVDHPLTLNQRDFWLQSQLHYSSAIDIDCVQVTIEGEVAATDFVAALQAAVDRQDALRAVFVENSGAPVQRTLAGLRIACPVVDLTGLDRTRRAAEVRRRREALLRRRFDLAAGPLFRAELLRCGARRHVFQFAYHHLILDGFHAVQLLREIASAYEARRAGSPPPPTPELGYRDFAASQARRLRDGALEANLAYWRRQLDGELPRLLLPFDHPAPAERTFETAGYSLALSAELVRGLEALGRAQRVTPFQTCLAAFAVLLSRLTADADVLVAVPHSTRPREMADVVGFFACAVPLRVRLRRRQSFADLLAVVKRAFKEAGERREVSLTEVFRGLYQMRQPGRDFLPVWASQVHKPDFTTGRWKVRGGSLEDESHREPWVLTYGKTTDLGLIVCEGPEDVELSLAYAAELFERQTIERFAQYLQRLLEQVAREPHKRIGDLELLSEPERERLAGFNATSRPYPRERCLAELFEEQVRRAPEADAVVFGEQRISYRELERRASRLAGWLRRQGVGPEVLVPLLLERSVEMVVALLAVVKAGGGYVPLETDLPPLRLQALLRQLGSSPVLLTQESLLGGLEKAGGFAGELLCAEQWSTLAAGEEIWEVVRPEGVAYVNFTSGSTGEPKGVLVAQRGVVRLVKSADYLSLEPSDVVAQISTYAWDAATFEIWGALLNGARLVLLRREQVLDFAELGRLLREERVSVVYLTTALFNRVVDEAVGMLSGARAVIVGGELASDLHFARAKKELPGLRLINEYGPTENTVFSSWQEMAAGAEKVSIGRPVSNSRVYVLDEAMEPVPVGVMGEMYLGGEGLARGYLGRAELTAERFVPDPFGEGGRLYRSGDRGRWLGSGELEFGGRLDEQVKVRGHRIEPAEVECALRSHPAVRDAVVVVREASGGEKQLVAYVVGEREPAEELRAHLTARLPSYMVPSSFVALDELPLTATGKVDRRRLPELEGSRPGLAVGYVAPRTELEERIAQVWCEVLGLERVGVHDDFFDLGGYSLKTIQVRARLQRVFELEVPLATVFERPTVAEQAAAVVELQAQGRRAEELPIVRVEGREFYPLSHAQRGLWFLHRLQPDNTFYNMVNRIVLEGPLDRAAFAQAAAALVERHDSLRTSFSVVGEEPVQRVCPGFALELPFHDLSSCAEAERSRRFAALVTERSARPFDLATPPLRAALVRLEPRRHVFVLVAHHLLLDGWSRRLLLRELLHLYAGDRPPLPELPVRYVDYAVWQNTRIEQGLLKRDEDYWLRSLSGELPTMELPGSRRRGSPGSAELRTWLEVLETGRDVGKALQRLGERCDATPFMVELALFAALLSRLTGREDLLVGTLVAGRDRRELEGVVGMFANMVVLRTRLGGDPTLEQVIANVRQSCVEAFTHQDYPFDLLVRRLHPSRRAHGLPIMQTFFSSGSAAAAETGGGLVATMDDVSGISEGWRGSGNFALGLICSEELDGRLTWTFLYDPQRVERDAVRGLKRRLSGLLESMAGHV